MTTETSSVDTSTQSGAKTFERLVIRFLPASAITAVVGIVFLILFFSGVGGVFGTLNDIAVVIQYLLMLPIIAYIHRLIPAGQSPGTRAIRALGILGALAVIVLQSMLVLDLLPFQRQIILVIPAFLVVTAWFGYIEKAGREDPRIPKGRALAILAGLVFGYPFWALNFKKRLVSETHDFENESL
jgi:hypothetical protein